MELILPSAEEHRALIAESLTALDREQVPRRIWDNDYTLWSSQPTEITNRLGWLSVTDTMREKAADLEAFSNELRREGFTDAVLLGMGGSSLGAEVLGRILGSAPGHPRVTVLDSTVPETVSAVQESIDPARTLFLAASKSGSTAETRALLDYFYAMESETHAGDAHRRFAAITDPGSPLEELARERGFRRIFGNPEDIGGRYSVLSYFGLVCAAAMGTDLNKLLDAADAVRERCAPGLAAPENEGCRLGAFLRAFAKQGRDKVTIIESPSLKGFGAWAEQLIAESTGKSGKGIVPVVGEPLAEPGSYGNDRLFVHLRLAGEDNSTGDSFAREMGAAGHPVAVMELEDKRQIGAAFYLWEFGVAVAGSIMGINPFNQPDVQRAKDATKRILSEYADSRRLPSSPAGGSLSDLLAQAEEGDYFCIMAYIPRTPEADRVFDALRRRVLESRHLATTLGYGPRFLHSTGQLHKGGPNKGLFLQVVLDHYKDLPVPGHPYSFGIMSNAESLGDLQSLQALGRRIVRLEIDPSRLEEVLNK
jgi:glucose-6-phosphate isomerase